MDEQRAQRINEAARRFSEALIGSYRLASERFGEAQQRQTRDATAFYERVLGNLRAATESAQASSRELAEQAQRGQEAGRELARESVAAYMEFMNSLFSHYRGGVEAAEGRAEREDGPEGNREYFRTAIEETNRRAEGRA